MKSEKDLLNTPLKDLSLEERKAAFAARDVLYAKTERENKDYKPKPGRVQVITDGIEMMNPADGKVYSSKSKYYRALKDMWSHVIEPGEQGKTRGLQGDFNNKHELKRALQQHLGRS